MSDAQQTRPDLHAIFGIDEPTNSGEPLVAADPAIVTDPVIAADPTAPLEQGIELGGLDGGEHEVALDPTIEMDTALAPPPPEQDSGEPSGLTQPSRHGSSARFPTDVIVDLGLASRKQVEEALEESRNSATTPERVLLDAGRINQDGLARALAERYGLDHLDLGVFQVDMSAANLINTTVAKRYQAVPVAFADKRTLL